MPDAVKVSPRDTHVAFSHPRLTAWKYWYLTPTGSDIDGFTYPLTASHSFSQNHI